MTVSQIVRSSSLETVVETADGANGNRESLGLPKAKILTDYRIAYTSRQASLIGRKEVLTGKAKFGIFGDGKEVAQVAMAHAFRKGDWRAGYYRDQTFMFAVGELTVKQWFAQLYADTDCGHEPMTSGRQMNSHFSTRYLDREGQWLNQLMLYNSSADGSPTASQMARLLGLGYASKLYRTNQNLKNNSQFSVEGNEVAFGTIGNASTAEGVFWECLNAMGVLQVPIALSVWDDGYGISVPNKYQMTKESISEICQGFSPTRDKPGIDIYKVSGWDYPSLVKTYDRAIEKIRRNHEPALLHVVDMTQPQGHSTSGSHERYKDKERMDFEDSADCLKCMREWMIKADVAPAAELDRIETESRQKVEQMHAEAWEDFQRPIAKSRNELVAIFRKIEDKSDNPELFRQARIHLEKAPYLIKRVVMASARQTLAHMRQEELSRKSQLIDFIDRYQERNQESFSKWLYSESKRSPLVVDEVAPIYADPPIRIPGSEVIQRYFDKLFAKDQRVFAIGEDIGHIGGVNQGFKDLQKKYGPERVTDTGIREATILGQGIGAAMRGLRPIVDIQYLDYLLYCFQALSDDLATLHYRSAGGQIAPVVIRTKGHRLEGIWHTGSPMGMIIHGIRGVHVCVPRNMVQAVGLYNTILQADDPALVVEVLNGYRIRENCPENLDTFSVPLGKPDIVRSGNDLTVVTYGACVRLAQDAAQRLQNMDIDVELIDVQTLLPFDRDHVIGASVEKTGAVLFLDEDVPGGATAYMMDQVLIQQSAYECLDAPPKTLTAKAHRAAYASDGDYWSKPNTEDIVEMIYDMMRERRPDRFPDWRA